MPIDYNRVIITRNVYHTDGRLIVEKGAVGTIRSRNAGRVGIVFDVGQSCYIETGYNDRLMQTVDFIDTAPYRDEAP